MGKHYVQAHEAIPVKVLKSQDSPRLLCPEVPLTGLSCCTVDDSPWMTLVVQVPNGC